MDKRIIIEFYNEAIKDNVKANGGYCPCKLQRDETTKCMCKEYREQLELMKKDNDTNTYKEGLVCHCQLYIAKFV